MYEHDTTPELETKSYSNKHFKFFLQNLCIWKKYY